MKAKIKETYLARLQETYPAIYVPGSRPLNLASDAADAALSGRLKLEGDVWEKTVREISGLKRWSRADLAALAD